MNLKYILQKPCSKCPYTLEQVRTIKNPCPECKANGYQTYEWLQKQLKGNSAASSNKDDKKR